MKLISVKKKQKSRTGAGVKALVGLLTAVIVVAAAVVGTGAYVSKLDTVYPNVTVNGVRLSGMTRDEALTALEAAGFGSAFQNVSATVVFPNDDSLTIRGEDAGLKDITAEDAADMAIDHGRDGKFLSKELQYLRSVFKPVELTATYEMNLDEDYIRAEVKTHTYAFNLTLSANFVSPPGATGITVVKGSGIAMAKEDDVFNLVMGALRESLESSSPTVVSYTLSTSDDDGIDLEALRSDIYRAPVAAIYDPVTGTSTESVTGCDFDVTAAQLLLDAAKTGESVTIPFFFTEPEVTEEDIESLLFRDIIAERTTNIAGTSNRLNNVTLAAAAVDGLVLNPGDEFSFNDVVGERTVAKGYKEAGAYAGGKTVQEIGGGICQVSSTLYDCVLYSDLEVVYRANHMFVVAYLPLGNDATVNWGTVDFKFKNNTDYPIKIESITDGRKLTIRFHGTKTDENYIKVEYVTLSTSGFGVKEIEDPSVAPGTSVVDTSGHGGYVVETYKYLYDKDDNLISKTFIAKSTYRSQDKIILIPVKTEEPAPTDSAAPSDSPVPSDEVTPSDSATPSDNVTPGDIGEPQDSPADTFSPEPTENAPTEEPTGEYAPPAGL